MNGYKRDIQADITEESSSLLADEGLSARQQGGTPPASTDGIEDQTVTCTPEAEDEALTATGHSAPTGTTQNADPENIVGDTNTATSPTMSIGGWILRIFRFLRIWKKPSAPTPTSPFIETDIILVVAGQTGSRKSGFINALLGEEKMQVGPDDSIAVCTTKVEYSIVDLENKDDRIILVDTPGFNDPYKEDAKVLEEILTQLKAWFPAGAKYRGGVIYLHALSAPQYPNEGWAVWTLRKMWNQRLVMVTTKGDHVDEPVREERHEFLLKTYWPTNLQSDAKIETYKVDDDAWGIVQRFLPALESNEVEVGKLKVK